ncbi:MAG: N-acetylglucosamine-6-phosphate deacetylase [Defluviitaleaceae bacterium]|nr:N-acetylglucosamine-6-phosphate deacetylase [Defluviitaleaceae bacterium]
MKIKNVQVLTADGMFKNASVTYGSKIEKIEIVEKIGTAGGPYLIPGLIDVHTHGALGGDHTDGNPDKLLEMAHYYAKHGTTSFLATTLTSTEETLANAMRAIADYKRPRDSAKMAGVNLEGPFFSHEKRGAQPLECLQSPNLDMFERLNDLSGGKVKMVCIAPELVGAMEFIASAAKKCCVSIAHSNADYATAMKGFENGATHVTHLFNGMSSFGHRAPGVVGAALDANAYVEVICDGHHLHPATVRAIYKMFPQRVVLISDSLRCAGMPDGNYHLGDSPVIVKNGMVTLADGSSLAGSSITLLQGVRNAVSLGIPLATAVMSATAHCAETIGMKGAIGVIAPGAAADMVMLDSDLNVIKVIIDGEEI